MAPRTRRSQSKALANDAHGLGEDNNMSLQPACVNTSMQGSFVGKNVVNTMSANVNPSEGNNKRTFSSTNTHISTESVAQANPAKKPRTTGPAHGRPTPLQLARKDEVPPVDPDLIAKAMGERLVQKRVASVRPLPCSDVHDLLPYGYDFDTGNTGFEEESEILKETEADWFEDIESPDIPPVKTSNAMSHERPVWEDGAGDTEVSTPSTLSRNGSLGSFTNPTLSQESGPPEAATVPTVGLPVIASAGSIGASAGVPPPPPPFKWPVDTDLVLTENSKKIMLTSQRPLIRLIIAESIENVNACLQFENAFPDFTLAITFVKQSLIAAAKAHQPGADCIRQRIMRDKDYFLKIMPLPRARICLFRREVKEYCNALCIPTLNAMGAVPDIVGYINAQLSQYTYTFPRAPKCIGQKGLVMRSKPYRNERIITAIRELYFSGGSASFASRFKSRFPTHQGSYEVPMPMVALVSTALYATLHEWKTGAQEAVEFSTTGYLDVYYGHIGTLTHIKDQRENAYHMMMADIYTKASSHVAGNEASASAPIAQLDLEELDG